MVWGSFRIKWVLVFFLCGLMVVCQLPFLQLEVSYGLSPGVEGGTNQLLGRAIDLYTQKEPYGGKGANQSSDTSGHQAAPKTS